MTGSTGPSAAFTLQVFTEKLFRFHRAGVGLRVVQGCPEVVGAAGVLGPGSHWARALQPPFLICLSPVQM